MLQTLSALRDGEGSKAVLALLQSVFRSEAAIAAAKALKGVIDGSSNVTTALEKLLELEFENILDLTSYLDLVGALSEPTVECGVSVIGVLVTALDPAVATAALVAVAEILPYPTSSALSAAATAALRSSKVKTDSEYDEVLPQPILSTRNYHSYVKSVPRELAPAIIDPSESEQCKAPGNHTISLEMNNPTVFVLPLRNNYPATPFTLTTEPAQSTVFSDYQCSGEGRENICDMLAGSSSPAVRYLHPASRQDRQSVLYHPGSAHYLPEGTKQEDRMALARSSTGKSSFILPRLKEQYYATTPAAANVEQFRDYSPSLCLAERAESVTCSRRVRSIGSLFRCSSSPQPTEGRQSFSSSPEVGLRQRYMSPFVNSNEKYGIGGNGNTSDINPVFISSTVCHSATIYEPTVFATAELVTSSSGEATVPGWMSGAELEFPKQVLWTRMSKPESRQLTPELLWPNRLPSRSPQEDSKTGSENQPGRSWSTPAMIFSTLLSPQTQQASGLDHMIPTGSSVNSVPRTLNYCSDSDDRGFQKFVMALVVSLGPKVAAYAAEKLYEVLPMPAQVEFFAD